MNIKLLALSIIASTSLVSLSSQAAVDGSAEVRFQSSITTASCDIGVYDEFGVIVPSGTIILPSLDAATATATGIVGDAVNFKVGPTDPTACFAAAKNYKMTAVGAQVETDVLENSYGLTGNGPSNMGVELKTLAGDPILNTVLEATSVATADELVVDFTSQLFNTDGVAPDLGLIGSLATFTTSYY